MRRITSAALRRHRWLRRLAATLVRYRQRDGDHYAAAITFFTLLSMVPLLMIAVSVAGFVLAEDQELVAQLEKALGAALPAPAADQVGHIVGLVVDERGRLGIVALAVSVYSGWSWISNLRDAVSAVRAQPREQRSLLRTILADVATLLGIGLALTVSFALASMTGTVGAWLLSLTGLGGTAGAHVVLVLGSLVLSLAANWLVIAWCLAKLPRQRLRVSAHLRPAAVAAVGLGALQQAGGLYLRLLGKSPAVATLGALVGLLLFVYLVVRWLLLVTVWTTTGPDDSDLPADARHASATLAAGASAGLVIRTLSGR
ncbi:inner membrane protein YhjD [Amycolatopsis sp. K13G38]|uniref:Inner membrane protein YhjD n=1 Tax=Amycolatopsis acididurans TaxID=2724524 RepID=A0ABX1J4E2_9PSEU|nr:YhjD/YihY/BrkB family envelope integrity protein [Amycolatopsis acididurans]NKQ54638.1 inner membrane protein YhjD [Amycolatopsis acididurans]